jgi:hypothetical protein
MGELICEEILDKRCSLTNNHYYSNYDKENKIMLDAAYVANKMRFINHHCTNANVALIPIVGENGK